MKVINSDEATCGVAKTLKIIGGKWTILILRDLLNGPKRFGELNRSLVSISPRTLALRLKQLEEDRIISRKVYPQIPLRVEYRLTRKGQSLNDIIGSMRQWGEKH